MMGMTGDSSISYFGWTQGTRCTQGGESQRILTGHLGINRSRADSGAPSLEGKSKENRIPIVKEKHLLLRTSSEAEVKC